MFFFFFGGAFLLYMVIDIMEDVLKFAFRLMECNSWDLCSMVYWLCWIYIFAVVYLDADTIVVKNIEELFKCGKFCANLKHSERLNSGVMVVEPSETVFNDMMSKVNTLPSYTGGTMIFFWVLTLNAIILFVWISLFEAYMWLWTW